MIETKFKNMREKYISMAKEQKILDEN